MIAAKEALERLIEGNKRFVSGDSSQLGLDNQTRMSELTSGQEPFAIILGCSDSRVPAEIVFDQGLGDLFVIRVAGNIVAPSQIGSIEFAAEMFKTSLVVVLGHSSCGAVAATLQELNKTNSPIRSQHVHSIVDRIRPAIEPLFNLRKDEDLDVITRHAIRANIVASANLLRNSSRFLEELIDNNELLIVGAEYSLETGAVEFFDGLPR